jgi:hypothetical protein
MAAAACRIAVSAALLISQLFRENYAELRHAAAAMPYDPIGILFYLFRHVPPSLALVEWVRVAALISTTLTLVGLLTRPMLVVSFVSSWFLAAMFYSYAGGWSHEYNGMLLVQLVLFVAPCGRALSVDAWLARRRGKSPRPLSVAECNVPVFAAQFMIAWMFFNAFCYKTLVGGEAWWRSDNLRNILAFQWLAGGEVTPPWVQLVANHAALYHTFALASMTAQGAMLLSLIFFRWPYRRALFGAGFVIETLGLGFMMSRWDISPLNPHWLVLYAVFVDWNYFFSMRDRASAPVDEPAARLPAARRSIAAAAWAWPVTLIAVEFVVSFATAGRLPPATYPFTPYPMYSRLYGKVLMPGHQSFEFLGPRFTSADTDLSLGTKQANVAYSGNFYATEDADLAGVSGRLIQAQRTLANDGGSPPSLALLQTIYTVPAYPSPINPSVLTEGVRGMLSRDGTFVGVSSKVSRTSSGDATIVFTAQNVDLASAPTVLALPIDYRGIKTLGRVHSKTIYGVGAPVELHGDWVGDTFRTRDLAHGAYIIALRATPRAGPGAQAPQPTVFFTSPIVEL